MGVRREGDLWRVQVQVKGRRFSTTARTREEAEGIAAKHRRDRALSRQGLPPERSLEDALTRWLDEYVPHLKRGHDYESHIRAILPHASGAGIDDAQRVWRDYVEANRSLSNSTHNRRGAVLRRVCTLAHKWGWASPGIASGIDLLPENPARHTYLTYTQVRELVAKVRHQETKDLLLIVAYSGLRPDEVMKLTADDVHGGCLHVRTSKTGRPRMVPVHPAIRSAVKRLPITVGYRWVARHFERARQALGKPGWRIYDLRHTAASWLIQAGADLVVVRDILGHTSLSMTGRYSHLATSHLRAAVSRMGQPKLHRAKKQGNGR